jgi:hypothetical protein
MCPCIIRSRRRRWESKEHAWEIRDVYRTLVGNPDTRLEDRAVDRRTKHNIKMVLEEIDWLCMSQSTGPCQNFLQRRMGNGKLAFKLICKPFTLVLLISLKL